jgi:cytochrome b
MNKTFVWDPLVRIFHWSLVSAFAANALVIDPESSLHHWIGYFVVSLIAIRVVWGFVGSRYARFSSFPPDMNGSVEQLSNMVSGRVERHVGHTPLGALMIYNLIVTMLVIGFSGYLMTTDALWGVKWPQEIHEISVTWAEFSVVLHIAAVLFESHRTKVNLLIAMITGYKKLPVESD